MTNCTQHIFICEKWLEMVKNRYFADDFVKNRYKLKFHYRNINDYFYNANESNLILKAVRFRGGNPGV